MHYYDFDWHDSDYEYDFCHHYKIQDKEPEYEIKLTDIINASESQLRYLYSIEMINDYDIAYLTCQQKRLVLPDSNVKITDIAANIYDTKEITGLEEFYPRYCYLNKTHYLVGTQKLPNKYWNLISGHDVVYFGLYPDIEELKKNYNFNIPKNARNS